MKCAPLLLGLCCSSAPPSSHVSAFSTPPSAASSSTTIYDAIQRSSSLLDPTTGDRPVSPIPLGEKEGKSLVVILPQLGEFDSSEYCEFLVAAMGSMDDNDVDLRCIGIGDANAARLFCEYTGLPIDRLLIDPNGDLHRELGLHGGPEFEVPECASDDVLRFLLGQLPGGAPRDDKEVRPAATAWLNCEWCERVGDVCVCRFIPRHENLAARIDVYADPSDFPLFLPVASLNL